MHLLRSGEGYELSLQSTHSIVVVFSPVFSYVLMYAIADSQEHITPLVAQETHKEDDREPLNPTQFLTNVSFVFL